MAGRRTNAVGKVAQPDIPLMRNSERSTLKKCEFLWDLTYNKMLKPQTEMPALRFGSLVHAALAQYYIPGVKRGRHPAKAFEELYEQDMKVNREIFGMKVDEDEVWVNAAELGPAMLNNYVDEYGSDDRWEVISTEMPFQTTVKYPAEHLYEGSDWFRYVGVVDGVWRDRRDKLLWIPDHKTAAGIGDKKWVHLTLDDQAGGYWTWGVDFLIEQAILKSNMKLAGMMYNILRKALPDERQSHLVKGKRVYLNLDGTESKKQPAPYFARKPVFRDEYDRGMARRRSMVDFRRIELLRSGELDISKNPGQFTCPSCGMRDLCEIHETGGDVEAFTKTTTKSWDPYEAHEIYDGR